MRAVPFTRVAGVLPLVACLERAGAPVERLATRAGVPSRLFDQPEAPIPMGPACRFFDEAARSVGCEDLGAGVGRVTESWGLGAYGSALRRCGTVLQALRTAVELLPHFASGHRDWIAAERDRVWLCMSLVEGIETGRSQVEAFVLSMTIHTIQGIAGPEWSPRAVRLPDHGRAWVDGLELDASIDVDPARRHVAIELPRGLLLLPLPGSRTLRAAPDPGAQLDESAPPEDLVDSLRWVIDGLLGEGRPSVDLVAEAACVSRRTLQRQLAIDGLTYSELLDGCRMERARELLRGSSVRAIDVAYELGYQDPANFTRAFRRWAGVTPREFRRHLLESA